MRKLILLFLLLSVVFGSNAKTVKVLFLGNSYIYTNNIPKIIADLAAANGDELIYSSNTPGGYAFDQHITNTTSLDLIASENWDYVVLQEQSQIPVIPAYRDAYMYPSARALDQKIKENYGCTQTVFYMTWGRKFGGKQCGGPYCSEDFVDFNHMQDSLETAYMNIANELEAVVSPVGIAWKNSIAQDITIDLFNADNSHPNVYGSYLTACTFYATLFQKSPEGINYYAFLPKAKAEFLQQIAADIVLTNPLSWNINKFNLPDADFTVDNPDKREYNFTAPTITSASYYWNTGAGYQAGTEVLNYTFTDDGTYDVCLVIEDSCGRRDTACEEVIVEAVGIGSVFGINEVSVYPNPTQGIITINTPLSGELTIMNALGKVVLTKKQIAGIETVNMQDLPNGIYYIHLHTTQGNYYRKVLKK